MYTVCDTDGCNLTATGDNDLCARCRRTPATEDVGLDSRAWKIVESVAGHLCEQPNRCCKDMPPCVSCRARDLLEVSGRQ